MRHATLGSCVGILLAAAPCVFAQGVIAYRNDTVQPVVVQSAVVDKGSIRKSKPQTLFPGEQAVDSLSFRGNRRIVIYDARRPNIVLLQVDVFHQDNASYSIRPRARAAGSADNPNTPSIELIKMAPPAQPSKGGPPGSPGKRSP